MDDGMKEMKTKTARLGGACADGGETVPHAPGRRPSSSSRKLETR
eukprot:CAMPEP_0117686340 /NCGR_PEP_ID=MMETSP0804-20121206/22377_1 /TAXON_ID=1074897 /ORGANISM="Tetraselmis astigmatica, Strain CCMP880" /LENGTH=44 /DNA_ID= /DNA_START= /DNA_END= /DNA_ORIENTATION=